MKLYRAMTDTPGDAGSQLCRWFSSRRAAERHVAEKNRECGDDRSVAPSIDVYDFPLTRAGLIRLLDDVAGHAND